AVDDLEGSGKPRNGIAATLGRPQATVRIGAFQPELDIAGVLHLDGPGRLFRADADQSGAGYAQACRIAGVDVETVSVGAVAPVGRDPGLGRPKTQLAD